MPIRATSGIFSPQSGSERATRSLRFKVGRANLTSKRAVLDCVKRVKGEERPALHE